MNAYVIILIARAWSRVLLTDAPFRKYHYFFVEIVALFKRKMSQVRRNLLFGNSGGCLSRFTKMLSLNLRIPDSQKMLSLNLRISIHCKYIALYTELICSRSNLFISVYLLLRQPKDSKESGRGCCDRVRDCCNACLSSCLATCLLCCNCCMACLASCFMYLCCCETEYCIAFVNLVDDWWLSYWTSFVAISSFCIRTIKI